MQITSQTLKLGLLASLAALSASQGFADYSSTVMSLNPLAYYRFSETTPVAADMAINSGTAGAIGNGFYVNDTTGAPTHPISPGALAGSSDTAAAFNPGYMQVPFDPSINPQGAFTAEAWVQPTVAPAGLTCAMAYGHIQNPAYAPNRSGWLLYQDNGTSSGGFGWNFRMYNHIGINRSLTLTGGDVPNPGTWYHVVVAYDGTNGFLYVNGVQVATGPAPGFTANVDGNFSVGTRNDLAFTYAGGNIDEVALYTNALSASDILAHYQNGTNTAPATPYNQLVMADNPLLYYRFNEPAFTPTAVPPTTANLGSWGPTQNGNLEDNMLIGQPGVPYTGFGAGNLCPHFNGLNASIDIPGATFNSDTCTITAWVRREGPTDGGSQGAFSQGYAGIVYQRDTATANTASGMGFGGHNELRSNWNDAPAEYGFDPNLEFPDRTWSMAALVFSPNSTVYFVNGVLVTNQIAHTAHDFSTVPIYIGQDILGSRFVQGSIDEVAIFGTALTAAQLQQLYRAGSPPPVITQQPQGPTGTVYEGFNVSLSGAAVGGLPLSYSWIKNNNPIPGQTTATLVMNNVHASDSGPYAMVVTNSFGSVTSSIVNLTVLASLPILTSVPGPANIFPNGTARFSVASVGTTPITYQWMFGTGSATNPIPGATGTSLVVNPVTAASAGNYFVVATNPLGSTNSPAAALTVLPVSPNYVGAVLTRSPVAYWRLNETSGSTAFDSQGGHDGTFNPITTTNGAPGPRPSSFMGFEAGNDSYYFNGNTSDLIASPLNLNSYGTIVCFLNPQGLPPTDYYGLIFERGAGSDVSGLNFFPVAGQPANLGYTWNGDPASYAWNSGLAPASNQWNFVAVVVEPNQATMYLDSGSGLQSSINTTNHGPAAWSSPTHLGTDPLGNRIYQGFIDEVAVFNRSLSQADIQAIHDAAYQGTFTPVAPSVAVPPVSQTLIVGDSTTLTAVPSGTPPLTFQWYKSGGIVAGATQTALSLVNVSQGDSGSYQFVVSSASLSATSAPAVVTVTPTPGYAYLTNNLMLHLKFDGSFADSSGRGNDATAPSGAPGFIAGVLGQGVHIASAPGTNYLTVSDNAQDLSTSFAETNSFSVAFWIRYTDRFNDVPIIGNSINSTYQLGWVFTDSANAPGKLEVSLVDTANVGTYLVDPVPNGPVIGDGNWHNAVVVVDRSNQVASAYIDGGSAGSWSIVNMGTLDQPNLLTIGEDPTGNYGSAIFDMDDLGIWRTALASYDARSIYFAGLAGHSFDVPAPPSVTIQISVSGGNLTLSWPRGTLLSSSQVTSGYTPVAGASAPSYTIPLPTSGNRFYRVQLP